MSDVEISKLAQALSRTGRPPVVVSPAEAQAVAAAVNYADGFITELPNVPGAQAALDGMRTPGSRMSMIAQHVRHERNLLAGEVSTEPEANASIAPLAKSAAKIARNMQLQAELASIEKTPRSIANVAITREQFLAVATAMTKGTVMGPVAADLRRKLGEAAYAQLQKLIRDDLDVELRADEIKAEIATLTQAEPGAEAAASIAAAMERGEKLLAAEAKREAEAARRKAEEEEADELARLEAEHHAGNSQEAFATTLSGHRA